MCFASGGAERVDINFMKPGIKSSHNLSEKVHDSIIQTVDLPSLYILRSLAMTLALYIRNPITATDDYVTGHRNIEVFLTGGNSFCY